LTVLRVGGFPADIPADTSAGTPAGTLLIRPRGGAIAAPGHARRHGLPPGTLACERPIALTILAGRNTLLATLARGAGGVNRCETVFRRPK
jgi:hypothetical protein